MSATVYGDYTVGPAGGMTSLNDYISFWKMENLTDEKGVNDLTNTNSVTFTAGKIGNAATFTGSTQRLSHIDNDSLSVPATSYTFALWAKVNNDSAERGIFAKHSATQGYYLRYNGVVTGYQLVHFDGAQKQTPNSGANLGAWCFLVCWYDKGAGSISLQINNGTPYTSTSIGDCADEATAFCVGMENTSGSHPLADGQVDALGFWKRVLTADERSYLYNSGTGREAPF